MVSDPIYFSSIVTSFNEVAEIRDQIEVCQGGPVVGQLYFGENSYFKGSLFGGPMLSHQNKLLLPSRSKSLFFNGFVLCIVDVKLKSIHKTKLKSEVIWLTKVDNGKLYYRESLDEGDTEKTIEISAL